MNRSLRLKTIASFVGPNEKVADVGADHGLLELYLIAKDSTIQVVAIENKKGPYKILDENCKAYKNVRLAFSDGLCSVDSKVTTIVIAGMGGLNIKKILNAYPQKVKKVKKIIIDAHRDIEVARRTIVDYGFKIVTEKIVFEEGKFYVINVFEKADKKPRYTQDQYEFGYKLYKDELWPRYKQYLIDNNNNTIEKIADNPNMQDKVLELEKVNERLENYGKSKAIQRTC